MARLQKKQESEFKPAVEQKSGAIHYFCGLSMNCLVKCSNHTAV